MPAMKILRDILAGVTAPVVTYFTRRMELKQARFEAELKFQQAQGDRMAELIRQGLAADANWEMEFANQARSSLKDEYVLAVVSIPAVLCFIKTAAFDGPAIVTAGFVALAATPVFYQVLFCSIFAATFGIRWWRRKQYDTEDTTIVAGKIAGDK